MSLSSRLTPVCLFWVASFITVATDSEVPLREVLYCTEEELKASCSPSDVIIMKQAKYGRMEMSRCLEQSFGHLGCEADVLPDLDRACSGRHACDFRVSTLHGRASRGCPKDLMGYLTASYICQKVKRCNPQECRSAERLTLTESTGALASATTVESGCGSENCPWFVQAKPGQRINVTLLDFDYMGHGLPPLKRNLCRKFVTITEADHTKDVTACEHRTRQQVVYTSKMHELQIQLHAQEADAFVIAYEVTGCPDIEVPEHAQVTRTALEAEVRCMSSEGVWHLTCRGTSWVGQIGACPALKSSAVKYGGLFDSSQSSAVGMIVVIGLGVALGVAIGVTLLLIALAYMKRKSRQRPSPHNGTALMVDSEQVLPQDIPSKMDPFFMESCPLSRCDESQYGPDNSYTSTLCVRRPLPAPYPTDDGPDTEVSWKERAPRTFFPDMLDTSSMAYSEPAESTPAKDHVYETPHMAPPGSGNAREGGHSADELFRDTEGRPLDIINNRTNK